MQDSPAAAICEVFARHGEVILEPRLAADGTAGGPLLLERALAKARPVIQEAASSASRLRYGCSICSNL